MTAAARKNAKTRVLKVLASCAETRLAGMPDHELSEMAHEIVRAVLGQPDGKVRR